MKVKSQPIEEETVFANPISDKGRVQDYKELLQLKKSKNPSKPTWTWQRHSKTVATGSRGEGQKKELCFNRCKVSDLQEEKVQEIRFTAVRVNVTRHTQEAANRRFSHFDVSFPL